jgi:hypothetical protein
MPVYRAPAVGPGVDAELEEKKALKYELEEKPRCRWRGTQGKH